MSTLFPPPQPVPPARAEVIRSLVLDACGEDTERPIRVPRTRPRLVLPGVGVAAVMTGVAVASWLLISGGGSQPALAAWTAVPQSVTAAQAAQLTHDCTNRVVGHFPIPLRRVTFSLAEHRGSSTAVLLIGAAGSEAICVKPAAASNGGGTGTSAGPQVGIVAASPMTGALQVDGSAGGPAIGLTAIFGQVTTEATTVTVTTDDGRVVTASVGHGHFLAWWPSASPAATVRALNASGQVIASTTRTGQSPSGVPVPRHSQ